jgi:hypothetical protein
VSETPSNENRMFEQLRLGSFPSTSRQRFPRFRPQNCSSKAEPATVLQEVQFRDLQSRGVAVRSGPSKLSCRKPRAMRSEVFVPLGTSNLGRFGGGSLSCDSGPPAVRSTTGATLCGPSMAVPDELIMRRCWHSMTSLTGQPRYPILGS